MKKYLSVIVILLFIGLAVAPSINANVSKEVLVEFTTEVCGLNGEKQTIKLSQKEVEEVKILIDSFQSKLYKVESREEAEDLSKEAIAELDNYGLLGGLSVKQAQRLVTGKNYKYLLIEQIYRFFNGKDNGNDVNNSFCFVSTVVKNSICFSISWFFLGFWFPSISPLDDTKDEFIGFLFYAYFPIRVLSAVVSWDSMNSDVLSYISYGRQGVKKGGRWKEMFGFTGLKISRTNITLDPFWSWSDDTSWYLGRAIGISWYD